ncbi:MAG: hypothetical protein PHH75_07830 [Candidatus Omnitrophica bacterium]|nr:hypothetical protein [Candidatus Omnitrophota bacterium]
MSKILFAKERRYLEGDTPHRCERMLTGWHNSVSLAAVLPQRAQTKEVSPGPDLQEWRRFSKTPPQNPHRGVPAIFLGVHRCPFDVVGAPQETHRYSKGSVFLADFIVMPWCLSSPTGTKRSSARRHCPACHGLYYGPQVLSTLP